MLAMDKQAHLWWGMAMVGLLYPVMSTSSLALACAIGLLKEVVDSRDGRKFDFEDLMATCVGAALANAWIWMISPKSF